MDFVDASGTRYQLSEVVAAPTPVKKAPVWPWAVGGLAVAGGLLWMASQTSRKANPVTPEIKALIAEARDPSTDFSRLENLSIHAEIEVRRALLDNANLCPTYSDGQLKTNLLKALAEAFPEEVAAHPLFVLHALIEPNEEFEGVVCAVVKRTADVGLIEHLFRMWGPSSKFVRRGGAENPHAPENVLRTLGNEQIESEWWVRKGVASNPNTPVDVLRLLGNQKSESEGMVREAVAENPSTPEDLLRLLSNPETESIAWVRWMVTQNPNTTDDVLRNMANPTTESRNDVREAAQKALSARGLA